MATTYIDISNRHIHLNKADLETLFGEGYELHVKNYLGKTDAQFAAEEMVTLVGPKGEIDRVRILGPLRSATQVEILRGDCAKLGITAPVSMSGDLSEATDIDVVASNGNRLHLTKSVIIALRHIHMPEDNAQELGLKNGDMVKVEIPGLRGGIMNNVKIKTYKAPAGTINMMHVDREEGNASGLNGMEIGNIII